MKTESVTYEIVAIKIKGLLIRGEKLTVRNVLSLTGGSASKIVAYIKQWHDEQKLIAQTTISEEFLSALAKEYAKVEARAIRFYRKKDSNWEDLVMDAMRCTAEHEEKLKQALVELATAKLEIASLKSKLDVIL